MFLDKTLSLVDTWKAFIELKEQGKAKRYHNFSPFLLLLFCGCVHPNI